MIENVLYVSECRNCPSLPPPGSETVDFRVLGLPERPLRSDTTVSQHTWTAASGKRLIFDFEVAHNEVYNNGNHGEKLDSIYMIPSFQRREAYAALTRRCAT